MSRRAGLEWLRLSVLLSDFHLGSPFKKKSPPVEEKKEPDNVDPIEAFHNHLDKCHQCKNHPFNLCTTGDRLIKKAGQGYDG